MYGQLAYDVDTTVLISETNMQTKRDVAARTRGARLEARISAEQKALFQQAATLSDRTLSEFVVASAQEAATRIIQTHETIALTRDEQIRFVSALLAAPAPNERLSQAASQYRAQTGL
ncbi:MAG: DUF1778 domain-containing protein [Betaproteobacteria bacterium]